MSLFFKKRFIALSKCLNNLLAVLLLVVFFIPSCKEEDKNLNEAILNFKVVDDLGASIGGANIYIFDNQQAYETALGSNNFSSANINAISVATGVSFNLEAGKEHFIHIWYFDNVRNYVLSNIGDGKIEKLEKQSVIDAKFYIGPVTGNLAFWTKPGPVSNKLPIKISFSGIGVSPDITGYSAAAPTDPFDPNASNITNIPSGTYTYSAKADNDCIWAGTINIQKGAFQEIELLPCLRGRISFYTNNSTYNLASDPITIVLDANDPLPGAITGMGVFTCGTGSGFSSSTNSGSFISVTRDLSSVPYTYVAKNSTLFWTGSFTMNSDTCIAIALP